MIQRCHNPRNGSFHLYGARGIRVCARWRRSYLAFLRDMGRRPTARHSLDRQDNARGYTPSNSRWATPVEQARNTRRNHTLVINGEKHSVAAWAERHGLNASTIHSRLAAGWSAPRVVKPARALAPRLLTIGGRTQNVLDWSRESGTPHPTILYRLKQGYTAHDAVFTPPKNPGRHARMVRPVKPHGP